MVLRPLDSTHNHLEEEGGPSPVYIFCSAFTVNVRGAIRLQQCAHRHTWVTWITIGKCVQSYRRLMAVKLCASRLGIKATFDTTCGVSLEFWIALRLDTLGMGIFCQRACKSKKDPKKTRQLGLGLGRWKLESQRNATITPNHLRFFVFFITENSSRWYVHDPCCFS
jgi:hypothetical protein